MGNSGGLLANFTGSIRGQTQPRVIPSEIHRAATPESWSPMTSFTGTHAGANDRIA